MGCNNNTLLSRVSTIIIFVLLTSLIRFSEQKSTEIKVQVKVKQGILEGRSKVTQSKFPYNVFLQIPYAKPPVGKLRFKDPQPAEDWEGVRDASLKANVCPQLGYFFTKFYKGNEDCLYLNVYTPGKMINDSAMFPVMFWIHGGGFEIGDGNSDVYGPDYIIEHNVIFVSINYRLGPLGFLCLNIPEVSGNAGLKDQVMALQWVSNNIHHFGGNPRDVTIFGQSAGGASTSLLMLSPLAQGLFSKVIAQSGTSANDWSINNNPGKLALEYAKTLGIETHDKHEVLDYLRNISPKKLILSSKLLDVTHRMFLSFTPVVENVFPNTTNFLTRHPRELLKNGDFVKVPYLSGFSSHEGLLSVILYPDLTHENMTISEIISDFQDFIPKYLLESLSNDGKMLIANKIKEFYFVTENNTKEELFDFLTDSLFIRDIDFTIKELTKHNVPTYYYEFAYFGKLNMMQYLISYPYIGACHGDDLGYIFKINLLGSSLIEPTQNDILHRNQMTELWTNFAKTGNPTPTISPIIPLLWKPVIQDEINYLLISDDLVMLSNPQEERITFWKDLEDLK